MKIGIITFHCAHNFGAVLQAYALKNFLSDNKHEVQIVNYRPHIFKRWYSTNPLYALRKRSIKKAFSSFCDALKFHASIKRRHAAFESFISEYLTDAPAVSSASEIAKLDFDILIFGSDQLWAGFTKFDKVYWGKFEGNAKKITYAISAANFAHLESKKQFVEAALKNFSALSVREPDLKTSLEKYTDKHVNVDLDPTAILDFNAWDKIRAQSPELKNKYVLLYQIAVSEKVDSIAYSIADSAGLEVVELCTEISYPTKPQRDYCAGPRDFLRYFKDAELVITTSFHGIMFSIINRKPFYFIKKGGDSEKRILNVLKRFHLEDRVLDINFNGILENYSISYENSLPIISDEIEKSRKHLLDSIDSAKNARRNS